VKFWLNNFFKSQREKFQENQKNSNNSEWSEFSNNCFEASSNENSLNSFLRSNPGLNLDSSIYNKWKYNTLLVKGKQGTGKATAAFSAAIDQEYEVIPKISYLLIVKIMIKRLLKSIIVPKDQKKPYEKSMRLLKAKESFPLILKTSF
jgi:hypothetical protein